ncbi:MAG TPA: MFS transporter [Planctomycetaceae bacterium]|jgi:FSR family fosmidomycin resistance protein-like MFS transporter|nr:MFS transporter [Planctomycetaceae bacterium]
MARYFPILCLALMHGLVDAVAMFIEPLWPELRQTFRLSQAELFLLLSITSVAPNFSQLLFGYVQDRYGSRYLLWLGPAVAAVCLSAIGLASTPVTLGLLLVVGSIGVGSFHPEGAVSASLALVDERTRGLSLFMVGGTAGLALGPMLSGNLVKAFGLPALIWLAVPAIGIVVLVQWFQRRVAGKVKSAVPADHVRHAPQVGSRWKLALLLLAVCSLRVVPNTGLTKALAFTLEARGFEANVIGNMQSLFLVSGSLGMLLVGSWFGRGFERWMMIVSPLASIPPLLGLAAPECPTWLILVLLIPAGVILIGTTPAMVSYAHQLFPRDAGMASALTMGLSWGISGLVVAELISWTVDHAGRPALLFVTFVPSLLLSAAGALALPKTNAPPTSVLTPETTY